MEEIKSRFAKNLVELRKEKGLTQSQLAEELNYSDKTISKWENGDALPDTPTLYAISKFFAVSMDTLYDGDVKKQREEEDKKNKKSKSNKLAIALLATAFVWFLAVLCYVCFKLIFNEDAWMLFIWAIPISFIVLLIFNSIWGKKIVNYAIISVLIWTGLLAFHLQFLPIANIWPIYFVGIPMQVLTLLWSMIKKRSWKKKDRKGE